ncbi:MAG: aldo/keto reductase [Isosphaeraceae bacterium]
MTPSPPNRREFLQAGAAGIAATGLAGAASQDANQAAQKNSGGVPLRPLGKTGQNVSLLCLGGHASTNPNKMEEKESLRLIQRAVDEGITFMDNCWDYHDGLAEARMGKALAEGGRRDKVFLMTKVCGRSARDAQSNLEESLSRLKTDHIDLWQFHEMVYDNDPDWVFAADGAIHTGLKALKDGKVRFLGFTGHKDPIIHLKMLGMPFDWAAVQMPLNVMDVHYRSFQKQVLPVLLQRNIGVLGMKSLGGSGNIVTHAGVPVEDALRYVLSLPISTSYPGSTRKGARPEPQDRPRVQAADGGRADADRAVHPQGRRRRPVRAVRRPRPTALHRRQHGFDTEIS